MTKEPSNILCFAPKHNVKKADATGAFQPEAKRFLKRHKTSSDRLVLFDNNKSKTQMQKFITKELSKHIRLDGVFFFCHGYKSGIQCGFSNKTVNSFAKVLVRSSVVWHTVIGLYACDTGRDLDKDRLDDLEEFGGDGGFADELRDALCRNGGIYCRVDAHTSAGHTSRNPNIRRFEGNGSKVGGVGGHYIIPFRSKLWKQWRKALKSVMRFDFPFMGDNEIIKCVGKIKA